MVCDWFPDLSDGVTHTVGGPFTRINWLEINLGSIHQVKAYLLKTGWIPTQWNHKDGVRTSPKLTEDSYGSITGDLGKRIKDRLLFRMADCLQSQIRSAQILVASDTLMSRMSQKPKIMSS